MIVNKYTIGLRDSLKFLIINVFIPIIILISFISLDLTQSNFLTISLFSIIYYIVGTIIGVYVCKNNDYPFHLYTAVTVIGLPIVGSNPYFKDILPVILIFTIWYRLFLYLLGMKVVNNNIKIINPINIATALGVLIAIISNILQVSIEISLPIVYTLNKLCFNLYILMLFLELQISQVNLKAVSKLLIDKYLIITPALLITSLCIMWFLNINISFGVFILLTNLLPPASVLIAGTSKEDKTNLLFYFVLSYFILCLTFIII